jgi:hypothetical protein
MSTTTPSSTTKKTSFLTPHVIKQNMTLGESFNLPNPHISGKHMDESNKRRDELNTFSDLRFNSTTYIQDFKQQLDEIFAKYHGQKAYNSVEFKRLLQNELVQYLLFKRWLQHPCFEDVKSSQITQMISHAISKGEEIDAKWPHNNRSTPSTKQLTQGLSWSMMAQQQNQSDDKMIDDTRATNTIQNNNRTTTNTIQNNKPKFNHFNVEYVSTRGIDDADDDLNYVSDYFFNKQQGLDQIERIQEAKIKEKQFQDSIKKQQQLQQRQGDEQGPIKKQQRSQQRRSKSGINK